MELDADLAPEAEVLGFARRPDVEHLGAAHFEALAEALELSGEERLQILRRVHATLAHDEVIARLHPAPEMPEE